MSVERTRSRVVATLFFASLGQDFFLMLGNVFGSFAQSFHNFSRTFAFLFNDQARKYEALTGSAFSGEGELANDDDD